MLFLPPKHLLISALVAAVSAQNTANVLWNIPSPSPVAGGTASISATFLETGPNARYFMEIVNAQTNAVMDVVVNNQTGQAAIAVWHVPSAFPAGTYSARVSVTGGLSTQDGTYIAPVSLTVSAYNSSRGCPIQSFVAETLSDFVALDIFTPSASTLIALPASSANQSGRFNIAYLWKDNTAENGWPGTGILYIDVLALSDISVPASKQTPTGTIVQTTAAPSASARTVAVVIPTVSAIEQYFGPAAVRINYTRAAGGPFVSAFSETFYIQRSCNAFGGGTSTTGGDGTTSTPTNNAVVITTNVLGSLVWILVVTIVVTMVFTAGASAALVWFIRRRRRARKLAKQAQELPQVPVY